MNSNNQFSTYNLRLVQWFSFLALDTIVSYFILSYLGRLACSLRGQLWFYLLENWCLIIIFYCIISHSCRCYSIILSIQSMDVRWGTVTILSFLITNVRWWTAVHPNHHICINLLNIVIYKIIPHQFIISCIFSIVPNTTLSFLNQLSAIANLIVFQLLVLRLQQSISSLNLANCLFIRLLPVLLHFWVHFLIKTLQSMSLNLKIFSKIVYPLNKSIALVTVRPWSRLFWANFFL